MYKVKSLLCLSAVLTLSVLLGLWIAMSRLNDDFVFSKKIKGTVSIKIMFNTTHNPTPPDYDGQVILSEEKTVRSIIDLIDIRAEENKVTFTMPLFKILFLDKDGNMLASAGLQDPTYFLTDYGRTVTLKSKRLWEKVYNLCDLQKGNQKP